MSPPANGHIYYQTLAGQPGGAVVNESLYSMASTATYARVVKPPRAAGLAEGASDYAGPNPENHRYEQPTVSHPSSVYGFGSSDSDDTELHMYEQPVTTSEGVVYHIPRSESDARGYKKLLCDRTAYGYADPNEHRTVVYDIPMDQEGNYDNYNA